MHAIDAYGYVLLEPGKPLQRKEFTVPAPPAGEAVVEVAGCGLCHTDIGFYTGDVQPSRMPVILGHEISGKVVAAGPGSEQLVGRRVLVPAVIPCGDCELCRKGRGNVCQKQRMPGNHIDGGFASHLTVPAWALCELPEDLAGYELAELSVISDAVTTPYQSLLRSGLASGELAVVIGVGGLGTYMVQLAKDAGAHVVAIDVDERKLATARAMGAEHAIDARGADEREIKKRVRAIVKEAGLPAVGWKVFETSGTAAGQATAFSLLSFAGVVGIVGFTMDKVTIRLSNVMAFDAEVFGNWGCKPEHYPAAADLVLSGRIDVRSNVEMYPLDTINDVIGRALEHQLDKRAILTP